jgi:hypothetical protein
VVPRDFSLLFATSSLLAFCWWAEAFYVWTTTSSPIVDVLINDRSLRCVQRNEEYLNDCTLTLNIMLLLLKHASHLLLGVLLLVPNREGVVSLVGRQCTLLDDTRKKSTVFEKKKG